MFCVRYLNNRHRVLAFEELFRGTTDNAQVHIKEVMHQAIIHNAKLVIIAHSLSRKCKVLNMLTNY